jgi:diaminopimelate decarboxylase/aspartate kinase
VLTQGFIAHGPDGRTVLLGRGGSDTSAALLAGRLDAPCEIWTDVPGMFTADPRRVPAARLLRQLSYDEAQEIATMGAKVLHPRAIAPVRAAGVPLTIRCTQRPELDGTTISGHADAGASQVKAISHRNGLVLVAMETVGMWQEVGFLARAFQVFAAHGLSVDLVSTSETSVTVSLDPAANALGTALPACLQELAAFCRPRRIDACASVSLVGRGIRTILHRLAPVFELFEEQRVHMLSQAASDLNLTVVVDEEHAPKLVERLHATLFAHRGADALLGPTWEQLFHAPPEAASVASITPWWQLHRPALLELAAAGTPAYITHRPTLVDRAEALLGLTHVDRVLFAIKANPHPDILTTFAGLGLGFETVSPGEIARVRAHCPDAPILFTPNFAPREEYEAAFLDDGVTVTLDNLHPLQEWPEVFAERELFVRLDPGKGRGHHAKVRTAGARSKFGVSVDQLGELVAAAERIGARIVGLHAHAGSGVLDPLAWQDTAAFLAAVAHDLPHVHTLDLGGGLGIPPTPGAPGLDLAALDRALGEVRTAHPRFRLQLEPGRFLVAEAGVLLTRVTQLKRKADVHYVGVDAGMHTLIRPALYGARHPLENLSRPDGPSGAPATVVGPICETGDVLARDRVFPQASEGDVLLIAFAGAYGSAMASDYNLRQRPRDVVWTP